MVGDVQAMNAEIAPLGDHEGGDRRNHGYNSGKSEARTVKCRRKGPFALRGRIKGPGTRRSQSLAKMEPGGVGREGVGGVVGTEAAHMAGADQSCTSGEQKAPVRQGYVRFSFSSISPSLTHGMLRI